MKLRIKDQFYDHVAARNDGSLGLLRRLKEETGFGRKSLEVELAKFGDSVKTADDIFEDAALLKAVTALAWLCKRHAGEEFTFAEAEALQFTDLEFVDDEPAPAPDPTVAPTEGVSPRSKSNGKKPSKSEAAELISTD